MTTVGFEPAQFTLVELESTPLDHLGKLSLLAEAAKFTSYFDIFLRCCVKGLARSPRRRRKCRNIFDSLDSEGLVRHSRGT